MAGKRAETLLEMMFFIKRYTLDRAWTDLTDAEFLWEPAPNTWSVRPVTESRTGQKVDEDTLLDNIEAGLPKGQREYEVPVETKEPELTTEAAEKLSHSRSPRLPPCW